ncbi:MAG: VanW family protein [Lachnospiraceae bacterium]|nr:VanW family protein [Lachnospiraceae bacterium]MDD3794368.1 VanW family protein [Lachnospiraceae bacterium]
MKKSSVKAAAAAVILSGAIFCTGSQMIRAEEEIRISKGVLIEGVDVSGMTAREAVDAVQAKVKEMGEATVTLTMGDETTITATLNQLGLEWGNKEIIDEVQKLGTTGNIVQRYKDQKDLEQQNKEYDITFTTDNDMARSYLEGCSIYNSEPVNGTIYTADDGTPAVEGGTDGVTLRVDDSVTAVEQAVEGWTGGELTVDLAVDKAAPDISQEELSLVKDVLGTATTDYSASSSARAINVQNGCAKLNGSLIFPGEGFSVTAAVVPFTAENGYEPAPSYEENRVVDSYGGGICQVSTTLYNAVLKSELEVTSRSNHTMIVTYVDPSKDAAIAEGVMDLAFVNNTDAPIYITGYTYGGQITFTIYGHETRASNRSIEFESRVTSTTEPSGVMLYPNTAQNVGYLNQVQSPHTGYTAELWKNIYEDGNLVDSVQINSSTYQSVGTAYDVGVATSNTALSQAIYTAIGNNDLASVQTVIANASSYTAPTETPSTSQPATEAPATEAPATEAPVMDEGGGDVTIVDPPE